MPTAKQNSASSRHRNSATLGGSGLDSPSSLWDKSKLNAAGPGEFACSADFWYSSNPDNAMSWHEHCQTLLRMPFVLAAVLLPVSLPVECYQNLVSSPHSSSEASKPNLVQAGRLRAEPAASQVVDVEVSLARVSLSLLSCTCLGPRIVLILLAWGWPFAISACLRS